MRANFEGSRGSCAETATGSLRLVGYWPRRALHSERQLGRAPQDRRGDQLHPARWEVRDRCGGAAPELVGKRVGASFAASPIEGAGVPLREGAQDALPEGEQLRQHQAAAGGGGVVPFLAPGMPTAAERARHEVDHCPYQAWCRSCVAGRGKADAQFRRESEEEGVAYVATDYAFMGEEVEDDRMSDRCLPILVHKFYKDRWVTSHVVEHKGADEWATKVAAL